MKLCTEMLMRQFIIFIYFINAVMISSQFFYSLQLVNIVTTASKTFLLVVLCSLKISECFYTASNS